MRICSVGNWVWFTLTGIVCATLFFAESFYRATRHDPTARTRFCHRSTARPKARTASPRPKPRRSRARKPIAIPAPPSPATAPGIEVQAGTAHRSDGNNLAWEHADFQPYINGVGSLFRMCVTGFDRQIGATSTQRFPTPIPRIDSRTLAGCQGLWAGRSDGICSCCYRTMPR